MKDRNLLVNHGVNLEKALELFGDIDTYNASLETFLHKMKPRIFAMKKYKEISDMANYYIEVHALREDAFYFGFDTLGNLSKIQEEKSSENDMFYITEHYERLERELLRVIKLVQEYLGEYVIDIENIFQSKEENFSNEETILIVDDSKITTRFVQKIFHKRYHCVVAENGKNALEFIEKASKYKIVAILLDLNMPLVNGYDVLDYLKTNKLFQKIPVSIITSDDSKETRLKLSSYDIIAILVKPFNERDIKKVLEETIYSKGSSQ